MRHLRARAEGEQESILKLVIWHPGHGKLDRGFRKHYNHPGVCLITIARTNLLAAIFDSKGRTFALWALAALPAMLMHTFCDQLAL